MSKPKRARTARREADRGAKNDRGLIERVYALERGGAPDRPIELVSASEVEPDAMSRTCPYCGGEPRLVEHTVSEHAGRRIRVTAL